MADTENHDIEKSKNAADPVREDYGFTSAFKPENLLREARRARRNSAGRVPEICILDPDGDMVRHLRNGALAARHPGWACYHTELYVFHRAGIVRHRGLGHRGRLRGPGRRELFASGCRLLLSMTSSGQIAVQAPPYFIVIERALRDEGTSYHYLPAADYSERLLS